MLPESVRSQTFHRHILTHFMSLVSFDTPGKCQKTKGFVIFSGGIERDQWHEMGQRFQMFEKGDSSNKQKMNGCSFQHVLRHNLSSFLS